MKPRLRAKRAQPRLFNVYSVAYTLDEIPKEQENEADEKVDRARNQHAKRAAGFGTARFPFAIMRVRFGISTQEGNQRAHDFAHDETDTQKCTFARTEHESRKEHHQHPRRKKCVREDLKIRPYVVGKEAFDTKNDKDQQRADAKGNAISYKQGFFIFVHDRVRPVIRSKRVAPCIFPLPRRCSIQSDRAKFRASSVC